MLTLHWRIGNRHTHKFTSLNLMESTKKTLGKRTKPLNEVCRITTCDAVINSTHDGKQSYGGGWYCNRHVNSHLRLAHDTKKLHYKTHLTSVQLFGIEDTSAVARLFFKIPETQSCPLCSRSYLAGTMKIRKTSLGKRGCIICATAHIDKSIKSSSYRVVDYLATRKPSADGLLLGMEWEISCNNPDKLSDIVVSSLGYDFSIAKYDGSVAGFEINTVPASLHMQKRRVERACNKIKEVGRTYGADIIGAGIHIHFDRNFFKGKPEAIEKFISFIGNKCNKNFIGAICGRYNSNWARIPNIGEDTYSSRGCTKPTTWFEAAHGLGKSSAVNTQHRNTFEIRAFASSLNYEEIAARLEFVAILARASVTKEFPVNAGFKDLLQFVSKTRLTYPSFVSLMTKKGFIK